MIIKDMNIRQKVLDALNTYGPMEAANVHARIETTSSECGISLALGRLCSTGHVTFSQKDGMITYTAQRKRYKKKPRSSSGGTLLQSSTRRKKSGDVLEDLLTAFSNAVPEIRKLMQLRDAAKAAQI